MSIAYLDCSSGISGDMFLAALLDAGLPPDRLFSELKKVPLGFYEFKRTRAVRGSLVGTRVEIHVPSRQPARTFAVIEELLQGSELEDDVKAKALQVFTRLAEVEGKLHNQPPSEVHFHELSGVDAIVDIVGACAGLHLLEISELVCSPLNVGGGVVASEHGTLPVPAPATAELLKGIPVYSSGVDAELVTPTGAALVATLAKGFGPLPSMKVERIGYGAGEKDFPTHPNITRLFLGQGVEAVTAQAAPPDDEIVSVLEANLDDMSPQLYGYFIEQALAAGALDVTCSAVQMKKNRPGVTVSVLCAPEQSEALARLLFEQTTTLGVRIYEARRKCLEREVVNVETEYGPIPVKVGKHEGRVLNVAPEFEDCQRCAAAKSVPLKQVILAAQLAYLQQAGKAPEAEPPATEGAESA
jgi:hypothetical protein